jgi:hypothetical protein
MKTKFMTIGCLGLLLAVATNASAQLVAGSPEDRLYQQISATEDPDEKMALCLDFERQFGESDVVVDIYNMLVSIHNSRNESDKVIEFGEKAIAMDDDNVSALMAVARSYALKRQQLPKAVGYAERAVDATVKMKEDPPPPQFTDEQWQQYISTTEAAARSILNYAKSVGP